MTENNMRKRHKHTWVWGGSGGGIWPWCTTGEHWWKKGTKLTGDTSKLENKGTYA